jgi:hypothetical protein
VQAATVGSMLMNCSGHSILYVIASRHCHRHVYRHLGERAYSKNVWWRVVDGAWNMTGWMVRGNGAMHGAWRARGMVVHDGSNAVIIA